MPWTRYKTGKPSNDPKWINSNCQSLDTISHVAHQETATRILKDGLIKSGLIYDKSKLRSDRILVNWLSPNHWSLGSRYGNVQFVFDFKKLCQNANIYWVEAITGYTPHACRFLITSNNYDNELDIYNPQTDSGPWIYFPDKDEHFWNGDFTLEFMFEKDLLIEECKTIDFTEHHHNFCNINHNTCTEMGLGKPEAIFQFISNIIANDLPIIQSHFTKIKQGVSANDNLVFFLNRRLSGVGKLPFEGTIESSDLIAKTLIKSALNFRSKARMEEYRQIISMFRNYSEYEKTMVDLIIEKFGITNIESLELGY